MPSPTPRALIVIDVQNDYFEGGRYPLCNSEAVLAATEAALHQARAQGLCVVLVQHVADASQGAAPFFNAGTPGVDIHPRIRAAAPQAPVVVKHFADSFQGTRLQALLAEQGIQSLLLCGMMTQNCVTHTAISKAAEPYAVTVLKDCCTTVDPMIHAIALSALAQRVPLADSSLLDSEDVVSYTLNSNK